jgi:hypothetical protein
LINKQILQHINLKVTDKGKKKKKKNRDREREKRETERDRERVNLPDKSGKLLFIKLFVFSPVHVLSYLSLFLYVFILICF